MTSGIHDREKMCRSQEGDRGRGSVDLPPHEFVCDSLNAGDEAATIMPRPVVVRSARL